MQGYFHGKVFRLGGSSPSLSAALHSLKQQKELRNFGSSGIKSAKRRIPYNIDTQFVFPLFLSAAPF